MGKGIFLSNLRTTYLPCSRGQPPREQRNIFNDIHNMKQQIVLLLSLLLIVLASCKNEPKQEAYNPFATPEGCVKEYLNAKDSCDMVRMLKCFSYDTKYESLLREHLQQDINGYGDIVEYYKKKYPNYSYKTDSIKLKEEYPNSAVVTVYYTEIKDDVYSSDYNLNVVKDSTDWKIEIRLGSGLSIR